MAQLPPSLCAGEAGGEDEGGGEGGEGLAPMAVKHRPSTRMLRPQKTSQAAKPIVYKRQESAQHNSNYSHIHAKLKHTNNTGAHTTSLACSCPSFCCRMEKFHALTDQTHFLGQVGKSGRGTSTIVVCMYRLLD